MADLLAKIASRDRPRSEATLQADIRRLLLAGDFGLSDDHVDVDLEVPAGGGRRIDIEAGYTAIEVKKNLGSARVVAEAEKQLAGYVTARSHQTGQHYVGILTDGVQWHAYQLQGEGLTRVTTYKNSPGTGDPLALFYWLEGILATQQGVLPTPTEIVQRLGAASTSHALDRAMLADLYAEHVDLPTVQVKRRLWAQLLHSALGTQFIDSDELFVEHTLLVNSADIIAHLVLGIDVLDLQPASLISGQRFEQAGIFGVVEQDFFDWTIEVPGGAQFVQSLARRLARFDWAHVEHDVLKILYESVIGTETRKRMGEYYTPDWLAEEIVNKSISQPLQQRVLDPACGSGTFLFHAVRKYLAAADVRGESVDSALASLSRHVIGVDLHPVAVALARVTYLLAIGRERLVDPGRDTINIPVYLGDSIQWRERLDLFTEEHLRISAGHGASLLEDVLRFPEHLLSDPSRFDRLVSNLASLAAKPRDKNTLPSLGAVFHRMAIAEEDQPMILETFAAMCRLHDEGRNHIWSYYIRNLARPVWLALRENRVDVLIGNPPWLSYRHMPIDMQKLFKDLSSDRGIWHGGKFATHQDLSALFVARAIQQYLAMGGSFAFVLPNAVLDRAYYAGFRSGWYDDSAEPVAVTFTATWDLRRLRPHPFPRGASVIFGRRTSSDQYRQMSATTQRWSGRIPASGGSWDVVEPNIEIKIAGLVSTGSLVEESPYAPRVNNGATIFPRVLFFVDVPHSPLGFAAGSRKVKSSRSNYEKQPWKDLERLEGVVETEFIRDVLLGESLLPYRLLPARRVVLPIVGQRLIASDDSVLDYYPGLADWWQQAVAVWENHRRSTRLTLGEQLDYRRKLSVQIPPSPLRLAYGASGMHVSAAVVEDPRVILEHGLYYCTISTHDEGLYLCAILNSALLTELIRPMMSYGKDERHVDKHIWQLPIPLYDKARPDHRRLVELGARQRDIVSGLAFDENTSFISLRRRIRTELATHPAATQIEAIVRAMLA
ncbi:N-6 DNA methylase [Asanoa siamensis]|uniref:N-6 DNA methylase n=1 Tax=Asanoa siamensis TaxID=926357 RepID=UPI0019436E82|nr:N-6 DNA methylase [Asanoa siamensis]